MKILEKTGEDKRGFTRRAFFSLDMVYRYRLIIDFRGSMFQKNQCRRMLIIMLNPSTADEMKDDPTVRRVCGFAQREGFEQVEVQNLFALRSTDPKALLNHSDPVGPNWLDNLKSGLAESEFLCLGWGTHGGLNNRDKDVMETLNFGWPSPLKIHCLGHTGGGFPKHPLYLAEETKFEVYGGRFWEAEYKSKFGDFNIHKLINPFD